MKTILFLLDRYPAFGGIETVTTTLSNALAEHYRIVICAQRAESKDELLQKLVPGITYRSLPDATPNHHAENLTAFHRILSEEKVDVVIYQDSYAPNDYLPLSISKECGVKLIVVEHNSPSHPWRWLQQELAACSFWNIPKRAKRLLQGIRGFHHHAKRRTALYAHCDRYILLADRLRPEFQQNIYTKDTAKLGAIGNPLSYSPQEITLRGKKKQVLFVGQFVERKGIDKLLRIWQRVAPQTPDWSLVLVGDGPTMADTKRYISQNGLQRIFLEGFSTNIKEYCRCASIFCMCSTIEGFPMVLPEAMCSGAVPIAFASFAALDDIFTDGISGFSIPPFDEEAYAERLLKLMQDDNLRERMSREALAQANKFGIDHICDSWVQLIESVLSV